MSAIVSDWAISWTAGRQPHSPRPHSDASLANILFQSCRCPARGDKKPARSFAVGVNANSRVR
jgi:hypothetical protein